MSSASFSLALPSHTHPNMHHALSILLGSSVMVLNAIRSIHKIESCWAISNRMSIVFVQWMSQTRVIWVLLNGGEGNLWEMLLCFWCITGRSHRGQFANSASTVHMRRSGVWMRSCSSASCSVAKAISVHSQEQVLASIPRWYTKEFW